MSPFSNNSNSSNRFGGGNFGGFGNNFGIWLDFIYLITY